MALLAQVEGELRFGNLAHIISAQREPLRALYAEKFERQRTLLNLGITYDPEVNRVLVPEKSRAQFTQIFEEILIIQDEINEIHSRIQAIRNEMRFSQTAD